MASVQQVASYAATILCSPSLHFNLESIVHLSDIALALRHAHNIARINKSFPFLFSVFFYFSRRKERNNICFVNYARMILLVFFSLPPFRSLSHALSRSICLSSLAMINRDTRLARSRVVSAVVFAEASQRRREKNACHFMGTR